MEALNILITFLAGLLLRIGLPLGITALAVLLLRRLDAHWQAEAERQRAGLPAAAPQRVPCWITNNCPAERRAACPIYAHPETPCWQYFRDKQGHLRETCLDCDVFRGAPIPVAA